jgi:hypothetical protein
MTDRDRLIELIEQGVNHATKINTDKYIRFKWCDVADYLLANGVIVADLTVGQTVYIIDDEDTFEEPYVLDVKVSAVGKDMGGVWVTLDLPLGFKRSAYIGTFDIGKEVFLTKEEAEEKLREMKNNG